MEAYGNGSKQPHLVMLTGGTGGSNLMSEMRRYYHVSAIVSMSDDGGSSGRLIKKYGGMPVGDLRQALVSLSTKPKLAAWFNYRPSAKGHPNGNLWLKRHELQDGMDTAIKKACAFLGVKGNVIPVTRDTHTLVLNDDGVITKGEYVIGHMPIRSKHALVNHEPQVTLHPDAEGAIRRADIVVIAPGNLYGTILPLLATPGLQEALRASNAPKVMIENLLIKPGQTDEWDAVDYVHKVEEYIGKNSLEIVMYNTASIAKEVLAKYAAANERPIQYDPARFSEVNAQFIGLPLAGKNIRNLGNDTAIPRSRILHDAAVVADAFTGSLAKILETKESMV